MESDRKIKVCHIISGDLWAGAEIVMFTLVDSLRECPEISLSAIVLNDGILASKLRRIGVSTTVIDESKNGFPEIVRQTKKTLRGSGIDILHTHRYKENILAAIVKKSCGIKALVKTVHGTVEHFTGLKKMKASLYSTLDYYFTRSRFDMITTVSDEIRRNLAGKFGDSRVMTVHNSVNPAEFKPARDKGAVRREFNIDESAVVIGAVGRMAPVKGFDIFLKMAKIVSSQIENSAFCIVGDGPELENLQLMARELGIEGKTVFPGFREDIADLINSFDILVLSSRHEGIPIVSLEGMALEIPIVAAEVGGVPEVIDDEVSGLLVPPDDPDALAEACMKIFNSDNLKARLIEGASEKLRSEFTADLQKQRTLEIYRGLVSDK